jgi:type II secretory pathway pseudopilin PulG
MDQPSHIHPSRLLRRSRRYGSAGTDEHEVEAVDRNRPGGSGQPPLPASRRGLALRKGGCTLGKQRDSENIRAFTLVELLIAAAITVVIVVMLGLMLGSLMGSASHASQRVDAFRDARAALQMMERDLRNLVAGQWDAKTPPNPITLPAAYFALTNIYTDPAAGNQQLYALAAARPTAPSTPCPTPTPPAPPGSCLNAGATPIADICAVGYYCAWDGHAYSLRRFFRDSCHTLCVMQGAGSYAADSALYDLNAPDAKNDVLAAYVWNFKITMYNSSGTVINTYPYICDPTLTTPNPLPAAIEISFNAMSPQAARTVMSISTVSAADWMNAVMVPIPSPTPNYQGLILPHTYAFRSRINLP